MYEKTRGIVLHTLKYGDDSLMVDILTESRGTVAFVVKIPRTHRGLKTQLLRPLTILQLEMDYRENRNVQRIRDMRVDDPFLSIPYEPLKEVVVLFLGEVLYYALRNEDRNPQLFAFLEHSLHWFDEAQSEYVNFHLALLIRLTRYLGFWPNAEDGAPLRPRQADVRRQRRLGRHAVSGSPEDGDRTVVQPMPGFAQMFDLQEGIFVPTRPVHGQCLGVEEAEWVPRFLRMNYATMRRFRLNRVQRDYVLDVLCRYYRLHVPGFPEVKSLAVLKEVLS